MMQISRKGFTYDIVPLHINICERCLRDSGRALEHSHDVYHIILYSGGAGKFSFRGKTSYAEPGLMILSSPGEGHQFRPVEKGELTYSEFAFSYSSAEGKDLDIPFSELLSLHSGIRFDNWNSIMKLDEDQSAEFGRMLERMVELKESSSVVKVFNFYRIFSDIFSFLSLVHASANIRDEDSISSRLAMSRDFIHARYAESIRVDTLAEKACVSKGHFQREFKRKYGVPPVTYIMGHRTIVARNLLRTTAMSCSEIASKVGFGSDLYYFSKVFKKITGATPTSIRRK